MDKSFVEFLKKLKNENVKYIAVLGKKTSNELAWVLFTADFQYVTLPSNLSEEIRYGRLYRLGGMKVFDIDELIKKESVF